MAPTYAHYCPVAHALEVVGDRWSLLIVRDLLRESQRFTDLLRSSANITPKWLTIRLRKLEEAKIVERWKQGDKREVWYKLTPAGQDLRPVVEALWDWGMRYAMWPPRPGEVVRPDWAMRTLTASLNKRGRKLARPVDWSISFTPGGTHTVSFDGVGWLAEEGAVENPDVSVATSPEAWATFLAQKRDERRRYSQTMQITGSPECVEEFLRTLGAGEDKAQPNSEH